MMPKLLAITCVHADALMKPAPPLPPPITNRGTLTKAAPRFAAACILLFLAAASLFVLDGRSSPPLLDVTTPPSSLYEVPGALLEEKDSQLRPSPGNASSNGDKSEESSSPPTPMPSSSPSSQVLPLPTSSPSLSPSVVLVDRPSILRRHVSELAAPAAADLARLRALYDARGPSSHYGLRGKPYLSEKYGLLLAVPTFNPGEDVLIIDVGGSTQCYEIDLLIWVRLTGLPEIVAGVATPGHSSTDRSLPCHWLWSPPPLPPASYTLSVKLLSVDGSLDFDNSRCSLALNAVFPSTSPPVLTLYHPHWFGGVWACCEACTRFPWCEGWTSPGGAWVAPGEAATQTSCQLFGSDCEGGVCRAPKLLPLDATRKQYSGFSRKDPKSSYFVGCGWSFSYYNIPCVDEGRDDMPYTVNSTHVVPPPQPSAAVQPPNIPLPVCTLKDMFSGRWVASSPSLACTYVRDTAKYKQILPMFQHLPTQPEECWLHDDLKLLSTELCEGSCPEYRKSVWTSELHGASYGTMFKYKWSPYECAAPTYTDKEVSNLFRNRFARPILEGASLRNFFSNYLDQRLNALGALKYGDRKVIVSTLALPHKIWHLSESQWLVELAQMRTRTKGDILLYMVGPFYSAERDEHILQPRALRFADLARPVLKRKGWVEIDWFGISTALSFDAATQMDGLHVVGPVMKQLFHMVMKAIEEESSTS